MLCVALEDSDAGVAAAAAAGMRVIQVPDMKPASDASRAHAFAVVDLAPRRRGPPRGAGAVTDGAEGFAAHRALASWRPGPQWRSLVRGAREKIDADAGPEETLQGWNELAMMLGDTNRHRAVPVGDPQRRESGTAGRGPTAGCTPT